MIIIKAGIEMLMSTLNSIIGARADKELTDKLKQTVLDFEGVNGVYDVTLHNYGPTQIIGSVHIEVSDTMQAKQIHLLTRSIAVRVFSEFGIILTVGIYAANDSVSELSQMKNKVYEITAEIPEIIQTHGFYADEENKLAMFDLIVDFKADSEAIQKKVYDTITELYPDYKFDVILDSDYSES